MLTTHSANEILKISKGSDQHLCIPFKKALLSIKSPLKEAIAIILKNAYKQFIKKLSAEAANKESTIADDCLPSTTEQKLHGSKFLTLYITNGGSHIQI